MLPTRSARLDYSRPKAQQSRTEITDLFRLLLGDYRLPLSQRPRFGCIARACRARRRCSWHWTPKGGAFAPALAGGTASARTAPGLGQAISHGDPTWQPLAVLGGTHGELRSTRRPIPPASSSRLGPHRTDGPCVAPRAGWRVRHCWPRPPRPAVSPASPSFTATTSYASSPNARVIPSRTAGSSITKMR